jgi:maleate cis-trans isomerase
MKEVAMFRPQITPDTHELTVKYFEESGIKIVHSKFMSITTLRELAHPSPGEIYHLAKATWDEKPEADGLFIGCLNFRAHDEIQDL